MNMRPIEIVVNASSGSGGDAERDGKIVEIFDGHGLQARIHNAGTGEELVNLARRAAASDAETIVAGGGGGGGGGGSRYDNTRQFDWLEWYYRRTWTSVRVL